MNHDATKTLENAGGTLPQPGQKAAFDYRPDEIEDDGFITWTPLPTDPAAPTVEPSERGV